MQEAYHPFNTIALILFLSQGDNLHNLPQYPGVADLSAPFRIFTPKTGTAVDPVQAEAETVFLLYR